MPESGAKELHCTACSETIQESSTVYLAIELFHGGVQSLLHWRK